MRKSLRSRNVVMVKKFSIKSLKIARSKKASRPKLFSDKRQAPWVMLITLFVVAGTVGSFLLWNGTRAAETARDPFLWPFTSDSPWNMPIGSGAQYTGANDPITLNLLDTAATAWINAGEYSHPMYKASNADPLVTVNYRYASGPSDCCDGSINYRIPANATPAAGIDRHLHILDPDGRTLHEVFDMQPTTPGANPRTAFKYAAIDLRGTGFPPAGGGNQGSRAYGGSAVGGLIRTWEIEAGVIRHPLALTLRNMQLKSPFVWPATAEDTGASTTYAGLVPMGSLVAIPPSVSIDSLSLTPGGKILARALQDYGAYVSDRGGAFVLYAEPSAETSPLMSQMRNDFASIRKHLRVVTNNTPNTVAGGGTRRQPLAPPLQDDTSTPPPVSDISVALTAPAAAASLAGTVTLNATASDSGSSISKVEFYVGASLIGTDTSSPYSVSWSTVAAANGTHNLTAKATNAAGNTKTSAIINVTVNNQTNPPVAKKGDVNGDGAINALDLSVVLTNYGRTGRTRAQGDLSGGGTVNALDLSEVLTNYGL